MLNSILLNVLLWEWKIQIDAYFLNQIEDIKQ